MPIPAVALQGITRPRPAPPGRTQQHAAPPARYGHCGMEADPLLDKGLRPRQPRPGAPRQMAASIGLLRAGWTRVRAIPGLHLMKPETIAKQDTAKPPLRMDRARSIRKLTPGGKPPGKSAGKDRGEGNRGLPERDAAAPGSGE